MKQFAICFGDKHIYKVHLLQPVELILLANVLGVIMTLHLNVPAYIIPPLVLVTIVLVTSWSAVGCLQYVLDSGREVTLLLKETGGYTLDQYMHKHGKYESISVNSLLHLYHYIPVYTNYLFLFQFIEKANDALNTQIEHITTTQNMTI